MNIGEAAKASGVSAKSIRYYEATGLVRPAERQENGYRSYSQQDVHTLRFIRRARDLGFTIEQIAELLALWRDRSRASADVKELALAHVAALKSKLAEIEAMVATLSTLAACCQGDSRPECPILEDLARADGVSAKGSSSSRRFNAPTDRVARPAADLPHATRQRPFGARGETGAESDR